MYLNYYSKLRNTIDGDYDAEVAKAKNKIVTKIITASNMSGVDKVNMFTKADRLIDEITVYLRTIPDHNLSAQYITFRIPKRSGGVRVLHAPDPALKAIQRKVLDFLVQDCKLLCHNAVHSYVKHRNCKTAIEAHQKTGARWFLKIDLKDFFDHCGYEEVITTLYNIHPLRLLGASRIRQLMVICFRNGILPQGAPTSPLLSNLYMLDFDYKIDKALRGYKYTRYADDILISKTTSFTYAPVVQQVVNLLPGSLMIKQNKLRYGSCNGTNWNLGLMYNKDREITVGYRNKHTIKNKIHNLFFNPPPEQGTEEFLSWSFRVFELKGLLAYYKFIEPEYFTQLIRKYQDKGYPL